MDSQRVFDELSQLLVWPNCLKCNENIPKHTRFIQIYINTGLIVNPGPGYLNPGCPYFVNVNVYANQGYSRID